MTKEERKVMENYVAELKSVADKVEQLHLRVDSSCGDILEKEVATYRELISIWRKRLDED